MSQKAFSLVELIIVIAIVGILATAVLLQFGNTPQLSAQDDERKVEINSIADQYFQNAVSDGKFKPLSGAIPMPPEGGSYQGLISTDSDSFKICAVLSKGKGTNCLENSDNPNCYCRSSHTDNGEGNAGYNNGGGNGNGGNSSPTPAPTPTPTSAPTPVPTPSNPWGQAIAFNGKLASYPSWIPTPEYVKANYDPKMNLSNEQVTVEAWIKPTAPTADNGAQYRIIDNTYRLTLVPRPNNGQVSYKYYFDVQSNENGPCGQTVVQSDPRLASDPWNINYYKTVSVSQFETWKHVAGVFKNSVFYIFENGVLMNTYNTVASGHAYMTICNDGRAMHIGSGLAHKSTPYYDYFQGLIDEVRISDIARFTTNFTPQKIPFIPDANTDMLYHFDGNTNDSSSNGLNGSITGTTEYITSEIPY